MTVTKKTAIGRLAAPFTVTDGVVTIDVATTSVAGLMTASDKTKLDGIAAGANNYSLPTASADALGGVKIGRGIAITDGVISAATGSSIM